MLKTEAAPIKQLEKNEYKSVMRVIVIIPY